MDLQGFTTIDEVGDEDEPCDKEVRLSSSKADYSPNTAAEEIDYLNKIILDIEKDVRMTDCEELACLDIETELLIQPETSPVQGGQSTIFSCDSLFSKDFIDSTNVPNELNVNNSPQLESFCKENKHSLDREGIISDFSSIMDEENSTEVIDKNLKAISEVNKGGRTSVANNSCKTLKNCDTSSLDRICENNELSIIHNSSHSTDKPENKAVEDKNSKSISIEKVSSSNLIENEVTDKDRAVLKEDEAGFKEEEGVSKEEEGVSKEEKGVSKEDGVPIEDGGSKEDGVGSKEDGGGCEEDARFIEDRGRSKEDGGGSKDDGAGSKENGAGSKEDGGGSKEDGERSKEDGAGSKEDGAGSKEDGAGSKEDGAGSKEDGAGSKEDVERSKEDGAGSKEDGAGSKEDRAGSKEDGAGSKEDGGMSKEDGAGSKEDGAGSKVDGAGSKEDGAGSKEDGALPKENGATSKEDIAESKENGAGSKENEGMSKEDGAESKADGERSKEGGGLSKEDGAISKEDGAMSKEDGGCLRKDRGGSIEDEGGSKEDGVVSKKDEVSIEDEGMSTKDGGGCRKDGGASKEDGGRSIKDDEKESRKDQIASKKDSEEGRGQSKDRGRAKEFEIETEIHNEGEVNNESENEYINISLPVKISCIKKEADEPKSDEEIEPGDYFDDPAEEFNIDDLCPPLKQEIESECYDTVLPLVQNLNPVSKFEYTERDFYVPKVHFRVKYKENYSKEQVTAAWIMAHSSLASVINMDMFKHLDKSFPILQLTRVENLTPSDVYYCDHEVIDHFFLNYGTNPQKWNKIFSKKKGKDSKRSGKHSQSHQKKKNQIKEIEIMIDKREQEIQALKAKYREAMNRTLAQSSFEDQAKHTNLKDSFSPKSKENKSKAKHESHSKHAKKSSHHHASKESSKSHSRKSESKKHPSHSKDKKINPDSSKKLDVELEKSITDHKKEGHASSGSQKSTKTIDLFPLVKSEKTKSSTMKHHSVDKPIASISKTDKYLTSYHKIKPCSVILTRCNPLIEIQKCFKAEAMRSQIEEKTASSDARKRSNDTHKSRSRKNSEKDKEKGEVKRQNLDKSSTTSHSNKDSSLSSNLDKSQHCKDEMKFHNFFDSLRERSQSLDSLSSISESDDTENDASSFKRKEREGYQHKKKPKKKSRGESVKSFISKSLIFSDSEDSTASITTEQDNLPKDQEADEQQHKNISKTSTPCKENSSNFKQNIKLSDKDQSKSTEPTLSKDSCDTGSENPKLNLSNISEQDDFDGFINIEVFQNKLKAFNLSTNEETFSQNVGCLNSFDSASDSEIDYVNEDQNYSENESYYSSEISFDQKALKDKDAKETHKEDKLNKGNESAPEVTDEKLQIEPIVSNKERDAKEIHEDRLTEKNESGSKTAHEKNKTKSCVSHKEKDAKEIHEEDRLTEKNESGSKTAHEKPQTKPSVSHKEKDAKEIHEKDRLTEKNELCSKMTHEKTPTKSCLSHKEKDAKEIHEKDRLTEKNESGSKMAPEKPQTIPSVSHKEKDAKEIHEKDILTEKNESGSEMAHEKPQIEAPVPHKENLVETVKIETMVTESSKSKDVTNLKENVNEDEKRDSLLSLKSENTASVKTEKTEPVALSTGDNSNKIDSSKLSKPEKETKGLPKTSKYEGLKCTKSLKVKKCSIILEDLYYNKLYRKKIKREKRYWAAQKEQQSNRSSTSESSKLVFGISTKSDEKERKHLSKSNKRRLEEDKKKHKEEKMKIKEEKLKLENIPKTIKQENKDKTETKTSEKKRGLVEVSLPIFGKSYKIPKKTAAKDKLEKNPKSLIQRSDGTIPSYYSKLKHKSGNSTGSQSSFGENYEASSKSPSNTTDKMGGQRKVLLNFNPDLMLKQKEHERRNEQNYARSSTKMENSYTQNRMNERAHMENSYSQNRMNERALIENSYTQNRRNERPPSPNRIQDRPHNEHPQNRRNERPPSPNRIQDRPHDEHPQNRRNERPPSPNRIQDRPHDEHPQNRRNERPPSPNWIQDRPHDEHPQNRRNERPSQNRIQDRPHNEHPQNRRNERPSQNRIQDRPHNEHPHNDQRRETAQNNNQNQLLIADSQRKMPMGNFSGNTQNYDDNSYRFVHTVVESTKEVTRRPFTTGYRQPQEASARRELSKDTDVLGRDNILKDSSVNNLNTKPNIPLEPITTTSVNQPPSHVEREKYLPLSTPADNESIGSSPMDSFHPASPQSICSSSHTSFKDHPESVSKYNREPDSKEINVDESIEFIKKVESLDKKGKLKLYLKYKELYSSAKKKFHYEPGDIHKNPGKLKRYKELNMRRKMYHDLKLYLYEQKKQRNLKKLIEQKTLLTLEKENMQKALDDEEEPYSPSSSPILSDYVTKKEPIVRNETLSLNSDKDKTKSDSKDEPYSPSKLQLQSVDSTNITDSTLQSSSTQTNNSSLVHTDTEPTHKTNVTNALRLSQEIQLNQETIQQSNSRDDSQKHTIAAEKNVYDSKEPEKGSSPVVTQPLDETSDGKRLQEEILEEPVEDNHSYGESSDDTSLPGSPIMPEDMTGSFLTNTHVLGTVLNKFMSSEGEAPETSKGSVSIEQSSSIQLKQSKPVEMPIPHAEETKTTEISQTNEMRSQNVSHDSRVNLQSHTTEATAPEKDDSMVKYFLGEENFMKFKNTNQMPQLPSSSTTVYFDHGMIPRSVRVTETSSIVPPQTSLNLDSVPTSQATSLYPQNEPASQNISHNVSIAPTLQPIEPHIPSVPTSQPTTMLRAPPPPPPPFPLSYAGVSQPPGQHPFIMTPGLYHCGSGNARSLFGIVQEEASPPEESNFNSQEPKASSTLDTATTGISLATALLLPPPPPPPPDETRSNVSADVCKKSKFSSIISEFFDNWEDPLGREESWQMCGPFDRHPQREDLEVVYANVNARRMEAAQKLDENLYAKTPLAQPLIDKVEGIPLVGLQLILEVRKDEDTSIESCSYICSLCSKKMSSATLIAHIKSVPHRLKYTECFSDELHEKFGKMEVKQWTASLVREFTFALLELEKKVGRQKVAVASEKFMTTAVNHLKNQVNLLLNKPPDTQPATPSPAPAKKGVAQDKISTPPVVDITTTSPLTKAQLPASSPKPTKRPGDETEKPGPKFTKSDNYKSREKENKGKEKEIFVGFSKDKEFLLQLTNRDRARDKSVDNKSRDKDRDNRSRDNVRENRSRDRDRDNKPRDNIRDKSRDSIRDNRLRDNDVNKPKSERDNRTREKGKDDWPRDRDHDRNKSHRYGSQSRVRSKSPRSFSPSKKSRTRSPSSSRFERNHGGGRTDFMRSAEDRKMMEFRADESRIKKEFSKLVDEFITNPESHPRYKIEWERFWDRRYREVKEQGGNPEYHDFKTEWLTFWPNRLREICTLDYKSRRDEMLERHRITDPDPQLKLPEYLIGLRKESLQGRPNEARPSSREKIDKHGYTDNAEMGYPPGKERPISPWEKVTDQHYEQMGPMPIKDTYEVGFSVVGTLKLLAEMEDQLGSLSPATKTLMKKAIETTEKGSQPLDLFKDNDNIVLLRLVNVKLSSLVGSGVLGVMTAAKTQQAIESTNWLMKEAEKFSPNIKSNVTISSLGLDINLISNATVGMNTVQIAQYIAEQLFNIGKSDVDESVLQDILIAVSENHAHYKVQAQNSNVPPPRTSDIPVSPKLGPAVSHDTSARHPFCAPTDERKPQMPYGLPMTICNSLGLPLNANSSRGHTFASPGNQKDLPGPSFSHTHSSGMGSMPISNRGMGSMPMSNSGMGSMPMSNSGMGSMPMSNSGGSGSFSSAPALFPSGAQSATNSNQDSRSHEAPEADNDMSNESKKPSALSLLQTAYDNEEEGSKDKNMDNLSLEELRELLSNFRKLNPKEQQDLTDYLKKLEATDNKKVTKLRSMMQSSKPPSQPKEQERSFKSRRQEVKSKLGDSYDPHSPSTYEDDNTFKRSYNDYDPNNREGKIYPSRDIDNYSTRSSDFERHISYPSDPNEKRPLNSRKTLLADPGVESQYERSRQPLLPKPISDREFSDRRQPMPFTTDDGFQNPEHESRGDPEYFGSRQPLLQGASSRQDFSKFTQPSRNEPSEYFQSRKPLLQEPRSSWLSEKRRDVDSEFPKSRQPLLQEPSHNSRLSRSRSPWSNDPSMDKGYPSPRQPPQQEAYVDSGYSRSGPWSQEQNMNREFPELREHPQETHNIKPNFDSPRQTLLPEPNAQSRFPNQRPSLLKDPPRDQRSSMNQPLLSGPASRNSENKRMYQDDGFRSDPSYSLSGPSRESGNFSDNYNPNITDERDRYAEISKEHQSPYYSDEQEGTPFPIPRPMKDQTEEQEFDSYEFDNDKDMEFRSQSMRSSLGSKPSSSGRSYFDSEFQSASFSRNNDMNQGIARNDFQDDNRPTIFSEDLRHISRSGNQFSSKSSGFQHGGSFHSSMSEPNAPPSSRFSSGFVSESFRNFNPELSGNQHYQKDYEPMTVNPGPSRPGPQQPYFDSYQGPTFEGNRGQAHAPRGAPNRFPRGGRRGARGAR